MTLADSHGYFAPITKPLPLPTVEAVASVNRMLRFNAGWTPYVLAVLGLLTRPESYAGEVRSEYAFAIGEGQNLLNGIEDIPVPVGNMYHGLSASSTNGAQFWTVFNPYGSEYHSLALIADDLDGVTTLTVTQRLHPDATLCGGKLAVTMHYLPVASKAYVVTGDSCSGAISDSDFATDGLKTWNWTDAKNVTISISAIYCALFDIVTSDPPVCIEA